MATRKTTKRNAAKKTAQRARPGSKPAAASARKATRANTAANGAKAREKATTGAKARPAATRAKRGQERRSGGSKSRGGILDAAAQVLARAKEPMGCRDIVEQAIAQKLWSTSGKTPQATLYAAIIREIAGKGKDARFEKVDRGRFQLRKGA